MQLNKFNRIYVEEPIFAHNIGRSVFGPEQFSLFRENFEYIENSEETKKKKKVRF
jgi:hypothetical protein